jgi:ABC-type sugar transport system substrate-binding protein
MWKFTISGSAKKSGVLTRAIINISSGPEYWTTLQNSAKKASKKFVILPANENYAKVIVT